MPVAKAEPVVQPNFIKKRFFLDNSPFKWWLSDGQAKLPPEIERDNVEYKVNLHNNVRVINKDVVEAYGNVRR